jgi:hypothetical protein
MMNTFAVGKNMGIVIVDLELAFALRGTLVMRAKLVHLHTLILVMFAMPKRFALMIVQGSVSVIIKPEYVNATNTEKERIAL